jgi:hypothetical protein
MRKGHSLPISYLLVLSKVVAGISKTTATGIVISLKVGFRFGSTSKTQNLGIVVTRKNAEKWKSLCPTIILLIRFLSVQVQSIPWG